MIATTERPPFAISVAGRRPTQGVAARDLALGYLRYISACWRGDPGAPVFATRLGAYWRSGLPPAPDARPDAVSPHGGGGRGIHWYETDHDVLGYIPGSDGGYQVPTDAIPRLVQCAPTCPGTSLQAAAHDQGRARVVRHQEEIGQRVQATSG